MFDKLTSIETKYDQMMAEMAEPAVQNDSTRFRTHSKAVAEMQPLVDRFREYKDVIAQINATEELLKDPDMPCRSRMFSASRPPRPNWPRMLFITQ